MMNRRRLLSGLIAAPAVFALPGAARAWKSIYSVVTDYGADPTGVIDSTAAVQAAINAARNRGSGIPNGIVDFEGGSFKCGALDVTGCATLELRGGGVGGATLLANQAGAPMIDMTGSQSCLVRGMSLHASNPSLQPSTGILIAASNAGGDSTKNKLTDTLVTGFFSSAGLCMIGTSDNLISLCDIQQGRGDRPALNHSPNPDWFISSPFKTITPGTVPCGENTFVQTEIHTDNMDPTLQWGWNHYYRDAYAVRHFGGNSSCAKGGNAHVLFQGYCRVISFFGTQFWCNGVPAPAYLFNGGAERLICQACEDAGAYSVGHLVGGGYPGFVWQ